MKMFKIRYIFLAIFIFRADAPKQAVCTAPTFLVTASVVTLMLLINGGVNIATENTLNKSNQDIMNVRVQTSAPVNFSTSVPNTSIPTLPQCPLARVGRGFAGQGNKHKRFLDQRYKSSLRRQTNSTSNFTNSGSGSSSGSGWNSTTFDPADYEINGTSCRSLAPETQTPTTAVPTTALPTSAPTRLVITLAPSTKM
jgi:hypothetical protein